MNPKNTLTPAHLTKRVATTHMSVQKNVQKARDLKSQHGRALGLVAKAKEASSSHLTTDHNLPRASHPINDNYCVNAAVYAGRLVGSKETVNVFQSPETLGLTRETIRTKTQQTSSVKSSVATLAILQSQKKDISPVVVNCY